jgi:RHS repeat-associated protein
VVSRFVYASGGTAPDYLIKGGATYRIVADHLGSPRLVVDAATGAVAQRLDYDEFGRVLLDTNPGFQPFGFAGGLYDRDTGLVHFGAREYDPETGRWTAKDPIGFAGGDPNVYAYAGNDPVNTVDVEGLMCLDSVTCTCMRAPAVCAELAAATGLGARMIQSAPNAPAAAQNVACRLSTLPGLGQLGSTSQQILSRIADLRTSFQQAAPNLMRDYRQWLEVRPLIDPNIGKNVAVWTENMIRLERRFHDLAQMLAEQHGISFERAWNLLSTYVGFNPDLW